MGFFPLIQKEKNIKAWFPETGPKYYHLDLLCLKKRRPNVKVTREIISVMKKLSLLKKLFILTAHTFYFNRFRTDFVPNIS